MSLFDKVFGGNMPEGSKTLTEPEAFAAIALAASASDGHIADTEVRSIASSLRRMQLFSSYNDDHVIRMFDKLLGILKREGVEALVDSASGVLPQELNETAFATAVDVVLADGVVEDSEKALLAMLQKSLVIDDNTAVKIIEVMIIKNRG